MSEHCSNGGCVRELYRGKYCYRCWVGVKWFSITARVRNLNGKCRSYVGTPLEMTREEFIAWAIANPPPAAMCRPSIDRIINKRGYRLDNIQWLELRQNARRDQKELNDDERRCPGCQRVLALVSDNFRTSTKRWSKGFVSRCRPCERAQKNSYQRKGHAKATN